MRIVTAAMLSMLAAGLATLAEGAGSADPAPSASVADQGVSGDGRGGKTHYGPGGMSGAMDAATAHCRQFGKKALVTQMQPAPDGSGDLGFECRGKAS